MRIREATSEDRITWDAFVDTEGGQFYHYFDWKYVHEARGHQYIPLLAETTTSEIIGILPVTRVKGYLSSILYSNASAGGLLLKRELSDMERHEVISAFLKYVDTNYSRGCSRFILRENLPSIGELNEEPTAALIENGYRFKYNVSTHLPCKFILELKQPFEEKIWKGQWSSRFRQDLNKVMRNGVVVIHDEEFNYIEEFIDMSLKNYKRHGTLPSTREQIKMELNTFRDKAKLFVALLDNRPIVALSCYYTSSTCFLWEVGSHEKDSADANKLCYKVAIEDACNAGYRYADLSTAETTSLASLKQRFKRTRVPFGIYEKRYSILRTLIELLSVVINGAWHDKTYIWKKRRKILDTIVRW